MIHYHGLPITPDTAAVSAISGGHAFISFAHSGQLGVAINSCQSFAIDNGSFSAWKSGNPITDWSDFYTWAQNVMKIPSCDFVVIPDVIDGNEHDNDSLIREWQFGKSFGAPVWHLHESFSRLEKLASDWHRVCIGSSGEFATVGTEKWWCQISKAMQVICDTDGRPLVKLHGLRMLNPDIFTKIPLSSADSTNIGRNIGIDKSWKGSYTPPTKEARALLLKQRIESQNSPPIWKDVLLMTDQGKLF